MIDLKPFCGSDIFRSYLHQPFSFGEFTYATNGHIEVRLPRMADYPEQEKKGNWDGPFSGLDAASFSPLNHRDLPPLPAAREEDCESCNGSGHEHDCPDRDRACDGGSGRAMIQPMVSTMVRGGIYDLRYITMMLALPGITVATKTAKYAPLLFRFDGGAGALMPLRNQYDEHIEIEVGEAA